MFQANLTVDRDFPIAPLDRRLFGIFVEHMGRCVYTGIFEPGHPTADEQGFRGDVAALTRELGATVVRYPGGNFMSGYDWEDGVGPRADRPVRLDLAWYSTETNQVGTNEFIPWARSVGMEPMLGVNLGTRGPDEARHYLEYVNHPGGTTLSEQRRAHGTDQPHDVKLWCLGNEMDGPWQICRKTATEYGRIALETGKLMKMVDPTIELAACGSSAHDMPTYGAWEDTVLEHCFDVVDYVSLHTYFTKYRLPTLAPVGTVPTTMSTEEYFAQIETTARFIDEVVAVADAVAARRHSSKRIMLSFDEWNVWYRTRRDREGRVEQGWPVAPEILEEPYTMLDALTFGGACISLLNHADRVKAGCLAQLVNAIAPIMTETGGSAWRQTIFYPFADFSNLGRGQVLRAAVDCPTYAANYFDPRGTVDAYYPLPAVPYLKLSAVHDEAAAALTLFLLNRHLTEPLTLELTARGFAGLKVGRAHQLCDADLDALNTHDEPDRIKPNPLGDIAVRDSRLTATLAPASWSVIRLHRA